MADGSAVDSLQLSSSSCTTTSSKIGKSSINKQQGNRDSPKKKKSKKKSTTVQEVNLAPKFKHLASAPNQDIEMLRAFMLAEQMKLAPGEREYLKPETERMLLDDWLVSRYLFKGYKDAKKIPKNGNVFQQSLEYLSKYGELKHEFKLDHTLTDESFPIEWHMMGGLIVGKPDLSDNLTVYMRLSVHKPKLLIDEELKYQFRRFVLHMFCKADQLLFNKIGKGVAFIFDFGDVSYENYDLETMQWLIKLQKCGPKMQAYIMIYNLPWVFNATFKLMSAAILSGSNRERLEFVTGADILNYVAWDNLPDYLKQSVKQSDNQD